MKKIRPVFILLFILITSISCTNDKLPKTLKVQSTDPFASTMAASQFFTIDSRENHVIEGQNGTTITCPKGCFKNAKGEIVEENVQVELSEALSIEEMILSNLTTTSDGKLLETDGMIYFNATANGEQLLINKDNPIHIEIPTFKKQPGMLAYKGVRDSLGNMNWLAPQSLDNFLEIIPLDSLDFLPEGFQNTVDKGMPYKNHKTSTKDLTDSLYYSLSTYDEYGNKSVTGIKMNEPYYNPKKQIIDNKYTANSYVTEGGSDSTAGDEIRRGNNCGIDPAIIKVICSKKYQHTFIATKEFEKRLKVIFKSCRNELLEMYINHLDKNLFEADSAVAALCESLKLYQYQHAFSDFAKLRQTKVKDADKYSLLLKAHYQKNLEKVKKDLEKDKAKILKELAKKDKEINNVVEDYRKLLWKREKYRMENYGFTWSNTGWINIDKPVAIEANIDYAKLEVEVEKSDSLDRIYTYVIYESMKSLYRLNTSDNKNFYVGNSQERQMLMPLRSYAVVITIGYKNETPYVGAKSFTIEKENRLSVALSPTTGEDLKNLLRKYEKYNKENKIERDLEYMEKFYKEEQRQKTLQAERDFIRSLYNVAFPCCSDSLSGEILFNSNGCKSCHDIDKNRVGPALANATSKYTSEWLYKFTSNSSALIANGDKQANELYNQYGKSPMPSYSHLSRKEIAAIYKYIDATKKQSVLN